MDELKAQAEELGIKVDGRWSEERLQSEIDKALSADDEEPADKPAAPVVPSGMTIKNLRANPIKSLGLGSYGERTFTELELTDPRRMARIRRAVELGLLKVTE